MRVFVTGASGFVGSAVVKELLQAGHQVLGMVRSDAAAEALSKTGAAVHRGDLEDLESIKAGAAQCDAVIHTAFNHDFSNFKANCELDRAVITAIGEALAGTNHPLVVTSGIGALKPTGSLLTESDNAPGSEVTPRAATEEAVKAIAAKGVNAYVVRLPPTVHDAGDHGFVPILINIAKQKGEAAYIGEGTNSWPAVHRQDAAALYRLIIEQQPAQKVFHAVAEQGIPFKEIAAAIGKGLNVPVAGKEGQAADDYFTWFKYFASLNVAASSADTRKITGWEPTHKTLMEDLASGVYFQ
jgi:nucleoside-diphosphate-sugar epimerase